MVGSRRTQAATDDVLNTAQPEAISAPDLGGPMTETSDRMARADRLAQAERLAQLEHRLRALEDDAEVTRLILSYGPLVDSGDADAVASIWEPDGVYDVDELVMTGREQISTMVTSSAHQQLITKGCAHVMGAPRVSVNGDHANAICYSLMITTGDHGFVVRRATANHWRLRRSSDGWLVTARTSRVLDGRQESPALLASGMAPTADPGAPVSPIGMAPSNAHDEQSRRGEPPPRPEGS